MRKLMLFIEADERRYTVFCLCVASIFAVGLFEVLTYREAPPVHADQSYRYTHIATTTTASLTGAYSILHTLTINNAGASAVITIYDLPGPGSGATNLCTGTPTTNKVAIITVPASGALPQTLLYDMAFQNGICIQDATAASDITVTTIP
jgi:hypothetical protein